jgi:hypothetical protein
MRTVETVFPDQEEVELEVLQAFPTFFVCADGTLVERDGTLIVNPDAGEILYRHMELLPKRPPAEEESEEEFAEASGAEAASRFDAALEWIDPLVGKMPYGLWRGGPVPSRSPAWVINRPPPPKLSGASPDLLRGRAQPDVALCR